MAKTRNLKILKILASMAETVVGIKQRMAAAIVYKDSIISVGINSKITDPFQIKYQRNVHSIYPHAEIAAIKRASKKLTDRQLIKSILYVVRIKNTESSPGNFDWGFALPCDGCMRAISEFGIKTVVYSTDSDQYIALKR